MQRQHAKDGLVAISVSLDDPKDKDAVERALAFLKEKEKDAAFTNVRVDNSPDAWDERLGIDGPPAVFVFDRDGRIARKFVGFKEAKYEEKIKPLVQDLLKK